jgi:hypothetical protein
MNPNEFKQARRRILEEAAGTDPGSGTIIVPMCGRTYRPALEHGLIGRAYRDLELGHLGGIHQLPFITPERVGPRPMAGPHWMPHRRLSHSILHAEFMFELGVRLDLPDPLIRLGVLLGLTHDQAIPPGGDSTMNFFSLRRERSRIDEDDQFVTRFHLHREAWHALARDFQLPGEFEQLLLAGIHGQGILGELHELADTLSYLTLDSAALLERQAQVANARHSDETSRGLGLTGNELGTRLLQSTRRLDASDGTHLVFEDPEALEDMLEARILLWQEVYTSRWHKYLEGLYLELLCPRLTLEGALDPDMLRDRTDEWLFDRIGEHFGNRDLAHHLGAISEHGPEVRLYRDREQLLREEATMFATGAFTLITHQRAQAVVKTKANRYRVKHEGRAIPFDQDHAEHAARLQALVDARAHVEPWTLYAVQPPFQVTPTLRASWQEARTRWHTP